MGTVSLFIVKKDCSYLCMWMTSNWLEKNLDPMWKLLNKEVDLGEPTSFLDHVYLVCPQGHCQNPQRYHSARNQFERFRFFFFGIISRFDFDFRRRGIFLKDSNFWCVRCSITHNVGCKCECAVACLHPHNSISNVVVSLTIYDDMYINLLICILISPCICVKMFMYICVWVWCVVLLRVVV